MADVQPEGCTGTLYLLNPDDPDEGHDVSHDDAGGCPVHPLPCPWCHRPTVIKRGIVGGTRALQVGGKIVGELCADCADESRDLDGAAADYSPDPPSASW